MQRSQHVSSMNLEICCSYHIMISISALLHELYFKRQKLHEFQSQRSVDHNNGDYIE